jgi:phosphopantothenate synthetase
MAEERLKILQMLEDGKISPEEATTLLRALEAGGRTPQRTRDDNRFLRVQVTNLDTGSAKVNVTIPIGLVRAGLRMAERFAPDIDEFNLEELEEMITSGAIGKLVEVTDAEDNERVEVYVE